MSSSFFMSKSHLFFLAFFLFFLSICLFFTPLLSSESFSTSKEESISNSIFSLSATSDLLWPTPGYTRITSPFGKRNAPAKRIFDIS